MMIEPLRNRNILVAYISMFFIGMAMFMRYQTLPFFMGELVANGGFSKTSQVIIGLFLLPNAIGQLITPPGEAGAEVRPLAYLDHGPGHRRPWFHWPRADEDLRAGSHTRRGSVRDRHRNGVNG